MPWLVIGAVSQPPLLSFPHYWETEADKGNPFQTRNLRSNSWETMLTWEPPCSLLPPCLIFLLPWPLCAVFMLVARGRKTLSPLTSRPVSSPRDAGCYGAPGTLLNVHHSEPSCGGHCSSGKRGLAEVCLTPALTLCCLPVRTDERCGSREMSKPCPFLSLRPSEKICQCLCPRDLVSASYTKELCDSRSSGHPFPCSP